MDDVDHSGCPPFCGIDLLPFSKMPFRPGIDRKVIVLPWEAYEAICMAMQQDDDGVYRAVLVNEPLRPGVYSGPRIGNLKIVPWAPR